MRISQVLAAKASADIIFVRPDASVRELIARLAEHNVGALVVSSDGSTLEGIVSERDVVRRLHDDESVLEKPVSAIMTVEVHTCAETDRVDDLMRVMTERRIRHL